MSVPNEELLARKWDRCLANTVIKSGIGLSVGIGLSFLFFRRKGWPIAMTTGFALGVSYDECAKAFNPDVQMGQRLRRVTDWK